MHIVLPRLQEFQSTHPRGVRLLPYLIASMALAEFQSTHPRGVRPAEGGKERRAQEIVSIHAPAWGATTLTNPNRRSRYVSIHAPAWGATLRLCAGRGRGRVSIHAPAWGATPGDTDALPHELRFNPRTRVGCDGLCSRQIRRGFPVSIHAPAWGATAIGTARLSCEGSFNPRTRVGCDGRRAGICPTGRGVFQSTHPRGVRQ